MTFAAPPIITPALTTAPALTPTLQSRLPEVGTTIFTVMSALAQQHNAINLGQGFPDFGCDPALIEQVSAAMHGGHNQYPPMPGVPSLRSAIADKIATLYGHKYDAASEITITAGATQALLTAILCAVHPGDEVIVIEPAFDSYLPAIRLAGGVPVCVPMQLTAAGFAVDWLAVRAAVTVRTRLIMVNTPHNPTGMVLHEADLLALQAIAVEHDLLVLADEVYEHMVFDQVPHQSASRYPALVARSFVVSSFGKTFHVTGWKVGYCAAPAALMHEFRKVHQFNVFTVNTPMQHALAAYLAAPAHYLGLPAFYQAKRDRFRAGLAGSRLALLPCQGSYFQLVDYRAISDLPEAEFAQWLTREVGVAAIPVSAFYRQAQENRVVRFCFAKQEATLDAALARLVKAL